MRLINSVVNGVREIFHWSRAPRVTIYTVSISNVGINWGNEEDPRFGYLVQLLPGAEFALGCRGRSDKVHAGSPCDVEHGIPGGDGDGEALGMSVGRRTTRDRGAVQTLTERSGGDIVVQKLAVNGQHHCEARVAARRRFVHYQADLPRRG